jgi:hypothetical protein
MKRRQPFDISLLALAYFTLIVCPVASGESEMVPMRDGIMVRFPTFRRPEHEKARSHFTIPARFEAVGLVVLSFTLEN